MQERFTFIGEQVADWHIDERTKNMGRQGIQAARRTLAACRPEDQSAQAA